MWTDRELEVMHHALGLLGEKLVLEPEGSFTPGFERAHTDLSLRIAEELARRER